MLKWKVALFTAKTYQIHVCFLLNCVGFLSLLIYHYANISVKHTLRVQKTVTPYNNQHLPVILMYSLEKLKISGYEKRNIVRITEFQCILKAAFNIGRCRGAIKVELRGAGRIKFLRNRPESTYRTDVTYLGRPCSQLVTHWFSMPFEELK